MTKRSLLLCLGLASCALEPSYPEGDLVGDCADGLDNDADGLVDCDDEGCGDRVGCVDAPLWEEGEYVEIQPPVPVDPFDADCSAPIVVPGDVVLTSGDDLDGFCLSGNAVQGDLTVAPGPGQGLEPLACLCSVGGRLVIDAPSADGLVLDGLEAVGALVLQELAAGATVRLDSLESAGELDVRADIGRLDLPSLEVVDGPVQLVSSAIEDVDASSLETSGAFVLQDVPALDFPDFGSLREVAGPLLIENTGLLHVNAFESLETVSGDVVVLDNAILEFLGGFGTLESIEGDLVFTGNPRLSEAEIASDTDHIDVGGERISGGNGGDL